MDRARRLKFWLWMLTGLAAAVATSRFLFGLGSTTHLSDAYPWGLWIGFDVMSGVALAAGGFIITATVYIFKLEKFHAIVRPAVLTAFLGYIAVVVGLLFDLGLPWNIWHMLVFWNPHSPLFEVGWCVMLYLTVLALEFFPVPAEEFSALARIRRFLLKLRLPLVIVGIALSTLHQSSLGSLFLIMPYRLHPLWYSPLLPVEFFVSAAALGLLMVMFENHATAYIYRRQPETGLLGGLGAGLRWVLILYLVLRFGDLAARGQLGHLWGSEWQVGLFWFEIAVMAIIPAALLFIPHVRAARAGQWAVASLGVFGVVLNRIDVGGFAHLERGNAFYVPAWTEIAISAGVVSAAVLLFLFTIEHFKVWEERPADPQADPHKLPEFDKVGTTWLGVPNVAARTIYSLVFILAASVGFAFLKPHPPATRGIDATPVHHARGGDILWIDGNLDGNGVAFKHVEHENRNGGKDSCVKCHHMNVPRDRNSGCYQCHGDMYLASDAFRHDWHASPSGGGVACFECHARGQSRTAETAKPCKNCHKDLVPSGAVIRIKQYRAEGYVEALHQLCIGCHAKVAKEKAKPDMARCNWCHKGRLVFPDTRDLAFRKGEPVGTQVVLPPLSTR